MSDKFQFVILLNGLHPRKVESVFAISTKDFDLEPKATINRKGKLYGMLLRWMSLSLFFIDNSIYFM